MPARLGVGNDLPLPERLGFLSTRETGDDPSRLTVDNDERLQDAHLWEASIDADRVCVSASMVAGTRLCER